MNHFCNISSRLQFDEEVAARREALQRLKANPPNADFRNSLALLAGDPPPSISKYQRRLGVSDRLFSFLDQQALEKKANDQLS